MKIFNKINDPVVIYNNDFKKCFLFVSFPIKNVDKAKIRLLKSIIFSKSNTYDSERKVYEADINNYCISHRGTISSIGDSYFLEFTLFFPCEDSLGENVLEKNLLFIRDMIYNPFTVNESYSSKEINDIKSITINNIERNFKNALWYYGYKNTLLIDEDNYLSEDVDNILLEIKKINEKNLYDYYKEIISENPLVFLIGNVNKVDSYNSIKKILLGDKTDNVIFNKNYYHFTRSIPDTTIYETEKTKFNSSGVYLNYKIKDMNSERDSTLVNVVCQLIDSSSSSILFDTLRKEHDFVYRCGASSYSSFGSITLWASTDMNNIDKCINCMKDVIEKINNIEFIKEKYELIKNRARINDKIDHDNINNILLNYVDKYIGCREKTFYEMLKDISCDDVKSFIDRLVLTNIYVGVGEGNE